MIRESFQQSGTTPVEIEGLNKVASIGDIVVAVSFNILTEILSKPVALLLSSDRIRSSTSSSEHSKLVGQSAESTDSL